MELRQSMDGPGIKQGKVAQLQADVASLQQQLQAFQVVMMLSASKSLAHG